MARHLRVHLHGELVGRLTQTDSGQLEFRYGDEWRAADRAPLSLSLPVCDEPYGHRATEPFFGGLLPEEGARERVARYLGVTANNDFALLNEIGGECAGAVALLPEGVAPGSATTEPALALTDDELVALLDDLPTRPLLAGGDRRLSLAGAQDKVAVTLVQGRIALPLGDGPTTHIIKPPIAEFEDTVANELLCMRTAARLGFSVAAVERRIVKEREFLLVTRYDRRVEGGAVRRVHQEDFCQALGVPTRTKYESEGGPKLAECFALLTRAAQRPALDRLALMRSTIFNVLIGNADAHAKNFSLLHGDDARLGVTLSPLYDLLSTLCYDGLSRKYAMKIGSKAHFDDIRPRHWESFAEGARLAWPQLRRVLVEICDVLPDALEAERIELDDGIRDAPVLERILADTRERCELTKTRLARNE